MGRKRGEAGVGYSGTLNGTIQVSRDANAGI